MRTGTSFHIAPNRIPLAAAALARGLGIVASLKWDAHRL
jgi:hypothetical protein